MRNLANAVKPSQYLDLVGIWAGVVIQARGSILSFFSGSRQTLHTIGWGPELSREIKTDDKMVDPGRLAVIFDLKDTRRSAQGAFSLSRRPASSMRSRRLGDGTEDP